MLTPGSNVERPVDATHRIIYSIYVELEPLSEEPPDTYSALCVPLKSDGMSGGDPNCSNGRPRPPKRRTIDLRVGDQILCMRRWRMITSIRAYRSHWLTEAQAAKHTDESTGYVYRLLDAGKAT